MALFLLLRCYFQAPGFPTLPALLCSTLPFITADPGFSSLSPPCIIRCTGSHRSSFQSISSPGFVAFRVTLEDFWWLPTKESPPREKFSPASFVTLTRLRPFFLSLNVPISLRNFLICCIPDINTTLSITQRRSGFPVIMPGAQRLL